MTSVLICYATRTAAARDVALTAAEILRAEGHDVSVADFRDGPTVDGAELVVVGSGINASAWYPEATSWLGRNADALKSLRVAVYNTCLAVTGARDEALGYNAAAVQRTGAFASESFAGQYVPAKVGFFRRLLMRSMRHPEQDHFDPDAVRAWARTLV